MMIKKTYEYSVSYIETLKWLHGKHSVSFIRVNADYPVHFRSYFRSGGGCCMAPDGVTVAAVPEKKQQCHKIKADNGPAFAF